MLGRHLRSLSRANRKTHKMNRSPAVDAPHNEYLRYDWKRVYYALAVLAVVIALAILSSVLSSCTQTQRSTMTGAFAACADSNLGTLVKPGVTVFDDVSGLIKGNAPTLEADLTSLAVTFGIDLIECSVVAVEAVLLAPPQTGSGSGEMVTVTAPPPGIARARATIAKIRASKAGAAK